MAMQMVGYNNASIKAMGQLYGRDDVDEEQLYGTKPTVIVILNGPDEGGRRSKFMQ